MFLVRIERFISVNFNGCRLHGIFYNILYTIMHVLSEYIYNNYIENYRLFGETVQVEKVLIATVTIETSVGSRREEKGKGREKRRFGKFL